MGTETFWAIAAAYLISCCGGSAALRCLVQFASDRYDSYSTAAFDGIIRGALHFWITGSCTLLFLKLFGVPI